MEKLLILTSTFPKNKNDHTPNFTFNLSREFNKDFKIFILAPYSFNSKKKEKINNLQIIRFKYWFNSKNLLADNAILPNLKLNKLLWFQVPFFIFFNFISMYHLIRKENIKIIHAHWILTQGLLAVLYKKIFDRNIKILVTSHGADIYGLQKLNFLKKWILKDIDKLTVVSNDIKKEVLKLNSNLDVEVISMGIDINLFNPNKKIKNFKYKTISSEIILLFIGRLSEKKGIKYLIEGIRKFEELNIKKDIKLLIVGDGEDRNKLENLSKKYNLSKKIFFLGGIKHKRLPEIFASSDIFIGPSIKTKSGDQEGFGLVFAEAMASGCPVITTDLKSISDLVEHNKTGLIVKQRNSNEIIKSILLLLDNKILYNKLKVNGIKHIKDNFNIKIIANKYLNILKKWKNPQ